MSNDNNDPIHRKFYVLPGETMAEYSARTGLPMSVLDWSYWYGEYEEKEGENGCRNT
jgi:hypothetical protein